MQRKIGTEVALDATVSPFDIIGASSAINRTASYFLNPWEKVHKIRKLTSTGTYDADIAKYIPRNARWYRHKGATCTHVVQKDGKFRLSNHVNQ